MYKVEECFGVLQNYSFVQWQKDPQSYSMHKLVHAWGFERLGESEQRKFSVAVLELVAKAVTKCSNLPKDRVRLMPHVMANFKTLDQHKNVSDRAEQTADDIEMMGVFLEGIGRFHEEQMLQQFVFDVRKGMLGEEHPDTISAMNNLASTLAQQGQLEEAIFLLRIAVQKMKDLYGNDHPRVKIVLANLTWLKSWSSQGALSNQEESEETSMVRSTRGYS